MPSVAQGSPEVDTQSANTVLNGLSALSKKRRWADCSRSSTATNNSSDIVTIFVHGSEHNQNTLSAPTPTYNLHNSASHSQRKVLPLGSKRLCLGSANSNAGSRPVSISATPKVLYEGGPHHYQHQPPDNHVSLAATTAPCHICHRKPRRKCDLDSLAYCEGCGQRTCFVCLRACAGLVDSEDPELTVATPTAESPEQPHLQPWSTASHGHRGTVCSRCCVERGEEGDVFCLGCIATAGNSGVE